ncbi:hypothetical protein COU36_05095 [Candidatus Micrarchaeota archaeon CG10_big_fil_rev_8_21_14_0_10_59_7]|nr:MAG: hypothetical protein COU36_05095 [Candidatus Micrarchaeota archaeon CG10_big_fil_rev_8_21_14_0_10_59_7]
MEAKRSSSKKGVLNAAKQSTAAEEKKQPPAEPLPKPPERDETVFLERVEEAAKKRNPKRLAQTNQV